MYTSDKYIQEDVQPLIRDLARANGYILVNNVSVVGHSSTVASMPDGGIPALLTLTDKSGDETNWSKLVADAKEAGALVFDFRATEEFAHERMDKLTDGDHAFNVCLQWAGPPNPKDQGEIELFTQAALNAPNILKVINGDKYADA